ncbi:MAG: XdhC family protein [Desulforhopalus sp.]|nr:XdhC family protein [Desulforhopalus sp.]
MQQILDTLINTLVKGQSVVLCAITHNLGSAPRTSGARMLVLADGTTYGSVGGGAVEGTCQAKARELLRGGPAFAELDFQLNATSAAEQGMVCGGSVAILLHVVDPESLPLLRTLQSDYLLGKRPLLLTLLPHDNQPPRLLLLGSGEGDVPVQLRDELLRKSRRAPFIAVHEGREVFVEPLVHPGRVHLVGAGHVALATAKIAAFAGFEVVVMDDRQKFANSERYPQASKVRVLESFGDCIGDLGPDDYVIIVTRGHLHDRDVLAQALRTTAGYIGMIGSRRKRAAVYESLRGEGFTDDDLARVHCPIGLAIGADTPEEIALSIVAELVQVRAGMNG